MREPRLAFGGVFPPVSAFSRWEDRVWCLVAEPPGFMGPGRERPAPRPHPGGSSLTSGADFWIVATVSLALALLPTINPREIIIEQLVVNKHWEASDPSIGHSKSLHNF